MVITKRGIKSKSPLLFIEKHKEEQFQRLIETGEITCEESYSFPEKIMPANPSKAYAGSLYEAEEGVDTALESKFIRAFTGLENIEWWHRNPSRKGFRLNGFVNHYPDFIVMTKAGEIVCIEAKGDHLNNPDTRQKVQLGRKWQALAGPQYRYYLVFGESAVDIEGVMAFDAFIGLMRDL